MTESDWNDSVDAGLMLDFIWRLEGPQESVKALHEIAASAAIPIMADVHFDAGIALGAIDTSIQGLRINPGNMPDPVQVKDVAQAAKAKGIPIRVGVNAGSLTRGGGGRPQTREALAERMAEMGLAQAELLPQAGLEDILISFKI